MMITGGHGLRTDKPEGLISFLLPDFKIEDQQVGSRGRWATQPSRGHEVQVASNRMAREIFCYRSAVTSFAP